MKTLALALTALLLALIPVMTPCATEDSTMCNWNSSTQGNGLGTSYVALTDTFAIQYGRNN